MRPLALFRTVCGMLPLLISATPAFAQTKISLKFQAKDFDFADATRVRPFPISTSLPSTCEVGDVRFRSDATPGQNFYACTSTNVWTAVGQNSFLDPGAQVTRTSSTTLSIGSDCSVPKPCRFRFGGVVYSILSPATLTLAGGGSGTIYIYLLPGNTFSVATTPSSSLLMACSGCNLDPVRADFPYDSIPLWTWSATSGTWDANGGLDLRTSLTTARRFTAGSNVVVTENGSTVSFSTTNFLPASAAVSGATFRLGGAVPASASESLLGLGAVISGGSSSGTMFGMNAASGFAGDLAHWMLNGSSLFRWTSTGTFSANRSGQTVTWFGNLATAANSSFRMSIGGGDATQRLSLAQGSTDFFQGDGLGRVGLGKTAPAPGTADLLIQDATSSTGSTLVQIQAGAGQSGDILQLRTASGTVQTRFSAEGIPVLQPSGGKPACGSTLRGALWYSNSGLGVADRLEVCTKDASDTYVWTALF